MNKEDEEAKIAKIFKQLGAAEQSAKIMAKQILKRAKQLAVTKQTDTHVELRKLLEIAVLGAQGITNPMKWEINRKKGAEKPKNRIFAKKFDQWAEKPELRTVNL